MTEIVAASRIRELNDQFRHALTGGLLHITRGVIGLGGKQQAAILDAIAAFDAFSPEGSGAARLAAIPAGESPANRGVQSLL